MRGNLRKTKDGWVIINITPKSKHKMLPLATSDDLYYTMKSAAVGDQEGVEVEFDVQEKTVFDETTIIAKIKR